MNHAFKPLKIKSNRDISSMSEAHPDFETKASPEQLAAVERANRTARMTEEQATKNLGATPEVRAKYKIEVTFTKGRTTAGPNLLGIQLWESGKRFHGGGDDLMYWCKDNRQGEEGGCWAPIISDQIKGEVAYCKSCGRAVRADLLTNMKIGRVSSQNLAIELAKLFRSLDSNADIYLKYHKNDVRYIAMERAKGPETAARLKGMHIYPLKNILRDTAAGADIVKRFHAFITS